MIHTIEYDRSLSTRAKKLAEEYDLKITLETEIENHYRVCKVLVFSLPLLDINHKTELCKRSNYDLK